MKVTTPVSVAAVPPSATTIAGAIAGADGVAVRFETLVAAVVLVKTTVGPDEMPLVQPAEVPVVNVPPVELLNILVAERLSMV